MGWGWGWEVRACLPLQGGETRQGPWWSRWHRGQGPGPLAPTAASAPLRLPQPLGRGAAPGDQQRVKGCGPLVSA